MVLRGSEVAIVVWNAGESVDRVDVARIEQVINPEVDVHVVTVGIGAFASGDAPVLVQVQVHAELPWKAATVDRSFGRGADLTGDRCWDDRGSVRRSGAEVSNQIYPRVGEQLNLLGGAVGVFAQVDDGAVVVVA